ncbi:MAG: CRISPR-associated protein Cas4 [Chloroflexota bacterium]
MEAGPDDPPDLVDEEESAESAYLPLGGTLIWYYYVCPREVWLMAHRILPQEDNEFLALGRLLHESSYRRERHEILIDNTIRIDLHLAEGVVAEVKKSSKSLDAARMQLAYYLYYLKNEKGIERAGLLLIPSEKRRVVVELTPELEAELRGVIREIRRIAARPKPPPLKRIPVCRNCAYAPICWS